MITLHTFPGTPELESFSPFCMKVEVYLRAQEIPYKAILGDPRKSPKGKMPFIDDDGAILSDSSAILAHLEKKATTPMDGGLGDDDRARAQVIQRTFEESLYWVMLWSRWVDDDGWKVLAPRIAAIMPAAVRWLVPGILRGRVKSTLHAQGTGRHSRDEIFALGAADIRAVARLLGDRPFFLGDAPRTIDVVAYAFLANLHYWERTPLKDVFSAHDNLVAFVERARARFKAGGATT